MEEGEEEGEEEEEEDETKEKMVRQDRKKQALK